MWARIASVSVSVAVLGAPEAARAERPRPCSFAGEPAPTAAQRKALAALDADIQSLDVRAGNHGPTLDRLRGFLDEPCFRGLKNVASFPELGSARALKDWWDDGGRSWLYSAIGEETLPPAVVLPPTGRRTLALDGNERHRLAPLLCRTKDADCGRESAGWMMRAAEAASRPYTVSLILEKPKAGLALCSKVERPTPAARYAAWRECLEGQRQGNGGFDQLPVGAFRAPVHGWLVVRGRRGHYTFSDELAAYDLATGAAYRAARAGDLGSVMSKEPGARERGHPGRAKVTVERGRLPVENLREAALMMMLWPERRPFLGLFEAELPRGLRVMPLPSGFAFTTHRIETAMSSDTWLSWDWMDGGKPLASGKVLFSPAADASADSYPSWLLEIAEAALQPGCPPAPLPPGSVARGSTVVGVAPADATRAQLEAADAELVRALTEASAQPCVSPRRE